MGTKTKIAAGVVVGIAVGVGGYYAYQKYSNSNDPDCSAQIDAKSDTISSQDIPDPEGRTA